LPTCEFTVLEGVEPFSDTLGPANALLGLADLWYARFTFDNQTHTGLGFAWEVFRDSDFRFHGVQSASKAALRTINQSGRYGSQEPSWYLSFTIDHYEGMLTRWSCSALLEYLEKDI
jgi:hypothetical protein